MLTDSTGYAPKWIDNLRDWWYEIPDGSRDNVFDLSIVRTVSLSLFGSGVGATFFGEAAKRSTGWINNANPIKAMSTGAKIVGGSVTVITLAFEVVDTWDGINNNTNGERVLKSAIQISGTIASAYIMSAAVSCAGAALAGGAVVISAPVLVPIAIGFAVVAAVYFASSYTYKKIGIE